MTEKDYEKLMSAVDTASGALYDAEVAALDILHGDVYARGRYHAALDQLHRAVQAMEAL